MVQSFRSAVADGARAAFRPKALSWVMAAGVLGPQLVTWTMHLWPPHLFAASYLAQAVAKVAMAELARVEQGWATVNLVVFPPVALAVAVLAASGLRRRRAASRLA